MVAYQSWSECDDNLYTAVENGVNVVIWFAVNLVADSETGKATLSGGPNRTCVEEKQAKLDSNGYGDVVHLISVGGWDAAHPDTSFSAEQYFEAFEAFSDGLYAGLDWDLEGNDNESSPNNFFTADCINLIGDLSTLLHDAGYVVSMAPPESYFDMQTSEFSKYVNLTYPEDVWPDVDPQFQYHGRNSYVAAYALNPEGEASE